MERSAKLPFFLSLKQYALLTKPGIILGNIMNAALGVGLASPKQLPFSLFCGLFVGLSCIIASACIYNNYLDRDLDRKMARTAKRPFVQKTVSVGCALWMAALLGAAGAFFLALWTNFLTLILSLAGGLIYVTLYSHLKYHSHHATLFGSIAGAIPPIAGYSSVTAALDLPALILFFLLIFWQMPHFFAIALYRLRDYSAANLPVLPLVKGIQATKIHMLFYVVLFASAALGLSFVSSIGPIYFPVVALIGALWTLLSMQGIMQKSDPTAWARKMFFFSLIAIMALCFLVNVA